MSSKRGRKRNDNLPPNRARDVQRAFRARRAAHLQALEQRVTELEEENTTLRTALNLPPASRPSLGKGPTGKDRPRVLEGSSRSYPSSARSRESSLADLDSPASTRTNSLSPSDVTSMRPSSRSAHTVDNSTTWDHSILVSDQHVDEQGGSTSYQQPVPPISTSMPPKLAHQYSFSNSIPQSSRNTMTTGIYMGSQQSHYSPTSDRPMSAAYNNAGYMGREARDESQYSYSQAQFPSHDSGMQSHSPTSHGPAHSSSREPQPASSNVSYNQRRSNTEPHNFRALLNQDHPHLPNPMQLNTSIRLPSPHRLPDNGPSHRPPSHYGGV